MTDSALDPDQLSRVIMLTFGKLEPAGSYWAYVAVKPSRYEEFTRSIASKQYNMQSFVSDGFGEAIVSGEGNQPPADITTQVAELFGLKIRDLFQNANPLDAINLGIAQLANK